MEKDDASQITNTTDPDKKNFESQDDWREYAYGGKSLLDDSDDNTKPVSLEQKRNLVIGHIPPVDDTDTKKGDSEPTQQKD